MKPFSAIAFSASHKPRAQKALEEMRATYGTTRAEDAQVIVVLGGDGTMLRALHKYGELGIPFYGMNCGTLGFMLNPYERKGLSERIAAAERFEIRPLQMEVTTRGGAKHSEMAFNEVALLRQTHRAARLRIAINGKTRLPELNCDGLLLSTPLGSTAYTSSAGGPIVPLDANLLPLTPISAFRPRHWPGALLHHSAEVQFDVLSPVERPVSATADSQEIRDVTKVKICESETLRCAMLFDPDNHLAERIITEQFRTEILSSEKP